MILSDREIEAAIKHKFIRIDPEPPKENWTSTAIDLTLDGVLLAWKEGAKATGEKVQPVYPNKPDFNVQAMMIDKSLAENIPISADGYKLSPQTFVLGFTVEKIQLPLESRIAARVEGKSSLARLGVGIHVTAPTIHAGFEGPIQLEIFNTGPFDVVLETGMKICQLILEEVRETPLKGYKGQFKAQESFKASG